MTKLKQKLQEFITPSTPKIQSEGEKDELSTSPLPSAGVKIKLSNGNICFVEEKDLQHYPGATKL